MARQAGSSKYLPPARYRCALVPRPGPDDTRVKCFLRSQGRLTGPKQAAMRMKRPKIAGNPHCWSVQARGSHSLISFKARTLRLWWNPRKAKA